MMKINVTQQVFEACGPRDHFFEKTKNLFLHNGLQEWPGLYRFSSGPKGAIQTDIQTESQTHIYTSELKKTHSLGFWQYKVRSSPSKFSVLFFMFILWVLKYAKRWHSLRSRKFISVKKEIRLFHLRILLASLNICTDRTEKLLNMIRIIHYIVWENQGKMGKF